MTLGERLARTYRDPTAKLDAMCLARLLAPRDRDGRPRPDEVEALVEWLTGLSFAIQRRDNPPAAVRMLASGWVNQAGEVEPITVTDPQLLTASAACIDWAELAGYAQQVPPPTAAAAIRAALNDDRMRIEIAITEVAELRAAGTGRKTACETVAERNGVSFNTLDHRTRTRTPQR